MPLQASRVIKEFRYAMYFDGVDDYIYIPDKGGSLTSFTLMLIGVVVLGKGDTYAGHFSINRDNFEERVTSFRFEATVGYVDTGGASRVLYFPSSTSLRVLTTPTNIIFLVDSLTKYKMIIGDKVWSGSFTYTPIAPRISLYMPRYSDRLFPLEMFVSYVLYYSVALTDEQIAQNTIYPENPSRNGLIAWFKADPNNVKDIDNDGILEWIDLSGFGNHGKIYGARLVQPIKSASRVIQAQRVLACAR